MFATFLINFLSNSVLFFEERKERERENRQNGRGVVRKHCVLRGITEKYYNTMGHAVA
jgi:hypothetical protein